MNNSLNEKVIVNWEKNIEILSFFGKNLYKIISLLKLNKKFCKSYIYKNKFVKIEQKFVNLPLLLSEACLDHNFFVFRDRSMIYGMWVHDHKVVCRIP